MRLLLVTLVAVLAFAAPANAQLAPAPTVLKFAKGQAAPVSEGGATAGACQNEVVATGGWDNGA
jgi:hypothetical protein